MRHLRYLYAFLSLFAFSFVCGTSFANPLIQAEAALSAESFSKSIYVDFSLNEAFQNAGNFAKLMYFNGDAREIGLEKIGNDIYRSLSPIVISASPEYYLYFECDDGKTIYQSDHIPFDSNVSKDYIDYICIGAFEEEKEAPIVGFGLYVEPEKNPDATYATQRVWLHNPNEHGFYDNDDWGAPCKNAVSYLDNGKWKVTMMDFTVNNFNNATYFFADIPYEVTNIHFLRLSQSTNHKYLHYLEAPLPYLAYGVCYEAGNASYEDFKTIGRVSVHGANAALLANVVEAFITYGKHPSNGPVASTTQNVYSTWFENKSATIEELKEQKILDYAGYAANGNSYEGLVKSVSYSVNDKWNGLCNHANIDPNTGQLRSSLFNFGLSSAKTPLIILGATIGVLILLEVIVVFIRKKNDAT